VKKEAILVIGGALLVAAVIIAWTLLSQDEHIIPHVYPMF